MELGVSRNVFLLISFHISHIRMQVCAGSVDHIVSTVSSSIEETRAEVTVVQDVVDSTDREARSLLDQMGGSLRGV